MGSGVPERSERPRSVPGRRLVNTQRAACPRRPRGPRRPSVIPSSRPTGTPGGAHHHPAADFTSAPKEAGNRGRARPQPTVTHPRTWSERASNQQARIGGSGGSRAAAMSGSSEQQAPGPGGTHQHRLEGSVTSSLHLLPPSAPAPTSTDNPRTREGAATGSAHTAEPEVLYSGGTGSVCAKHNRKCLAG